MEQIGSAGTVGRPLSPIRRGGVERVEGGHGAQGCTLCSTGWNLIGKRIAGAKTIRDMQPRALRAGSDHELEIRSLAEQALAASEVPDREVIHGRFPPIRGRVFVADESHRRRSPYRPGGGSLPCIEPRINEHREPPPRGNTLGGATPEAHPVARITRIAA